MASVSSQRYPGPYLKASLLIAVGFLSTTSFVGDIGEDFVRDLVVAAGWHRPTIGRLGGPWVDGRARNAHAMHRDADVMAAAAKLRKRYDAEPTPENMHAASVAALVQGDDDDAIELLEQVTTSRPGHARALSDLAAAYIQRATTGQHFEDYVRALAASIRAITADPDHAPGHFNRALALDALFLRDQAQAARQEFLKLRPSRESQQDLDLMTGTLQHYSRSGGRVAVAVADSVSKPRPSSEEEERWAVADVTAVCEAPHGTRNGGVSAERETHAERFAAETGDRFYLAVAAATSALRRLPPREAAAACQAVEDYRTARQLYEADKIQEAGPAFDRAAAELRSHPWGLWSNLHRAIIGYYNGRLEHALRILDNLELQAQQRSFRLLQARVLWVRGLIRHTQGLYEDSIASYRQAVEIIRAVRDIEGEAALEALLADSYDLLADQQAGWEHRRVALAHLSGPLTPRRRHTIVRSAIRACLDLELPEAALQFQNTLIANAERWGQPAAVSEAYLGRASVYARLQSRRAFDDLESARTWAHRVMDATLAPRLGRELADAESRVREALEPRVAIEALTTAIANATQSKADFQLPVMYARRGQLHMTVGRPQDAERDLSQAIALAERLRGSLRSNLNRRGAFDRNFDAFDVMIELQVRAGRFAEALRYAERGRGMPLTPAGRQGDRAEDAMPVDPATLGTRLGPDTRVLYVVQVRDRLLSFLIAPDGLSWLDCSISGRRLQQLVDQQRNALQRGDGVALAKASRPITACVLDEHLPRLRGVQRLAIVPAGPLNALSFAALLMPDTKQYLVEHFVLAIAPSASRLLRGTALRMQPPSTALAVTNPRPATLDGNPLADLRYAEADAIAVERSYANVVVLARARATRQAFVDLAPKAEMVHYAGHAVAHPTNTALSRLILADAVDRSGSLFMGDILKLSFDHTKLVVLAGCSTAEGRLLRGAGTVSLATAFLDAGVPNVVASLWAVEDREANALFRTFHLAIARGLSPAVALREAQLSVLKQTVPRYGRPQVWAAFQSLGSISTSSIGG